MKSKIFKSLLSIGLSLLLLLIPASLSFAEDENNVISPATGISGKAEIKSKDEIIYAILESEGSVRNMYAVNYFKIDEEGSIKDFGDYTSVQNLSDTTPIEYSGDTITIETDTDNFYYQGNMATTELPWIFDVEYSLDGIKTAGQELAGKSGKLVINITSKQNSTVNSTFYENYMLQISMTLDTEKCDNINTTGATIANSGKNKLITYTILPGGDADISLSTTVKDFTMTGIDIVAMPYTMDLEMPDMDSMISDFTSLSDAIADLDKGVGKLADGVAELQVGADKLSNGSSDIKTGLSDLSGNSKQLMQASSQIDGALTKIVSSLSGASGEMDLGELAQLPQGLSQLTDGLNKISAGLINLKNGFIPAYTALDSAIQSIPEEAINQEQIMALYYKIGGDQELTALLDQLIASYTANQTIKGTYDQVKGAFDAISPTIDSLSSSIDTISALLDEMTKKISEALSNMDMMQQLAQLSAGLSELDKNYTVFHKGLGIYMDGVSELSSSYSDFDKGLSTFKNGVDGLYDGVTELHDGTTELSDETDKIPNTIQEKIDDMLDQYTGSDFEPISFTSSKNEHTELVQFVLKCDGIEKAEKIENETVKAGKETFWDRFIALFTGKK